MRCIELALGDAPKAGDRVKIFNQMTETHRVRDLAELVGELTGAEIACLPNPRKEAAENDLIVRTTSSWRSGSTRRRWPRVCCRRWSTSPGNTPTASTASACPPCPPGPRTSPSGRARPGGQSAEIGVMTRRTSSATGAVRCNAYVTLVTNADFALGAKALAALASRLTGTAADLVVLHTGGVGDADLAPLARSGRAADAPWSCCRPRTPSTRPMPATGCTAPRPSPRGASRRSTRRSTISPSCGSGSWTTTGSCFSMPTRWCCAIATGCSTIPNSVPRRTSTRASPISTG